MAKRFAGPIQTEGEVYAHLGGVRFPDSTLQASAAPAFTLYTAKGQLMVGKASGSTDILAPTTDGYVLTLDSAQTLGLKWSPVSVTLAPEINAAAREYAFNNFK